ncbi:SH3 domain-containing protein Dlish-like isoform X2 [Stylophora pistillata]|uniref:SH3 domain-containing protein Dlish-like isoform X2 n=1 Tax=Stylophora pistillata TaxID=50429 RepID=UPI000C0398FA|nr:SH3 domain-containing protein Dlish-like isoform X2 [Stylophora pistillata]
MAFFCPSQLTLKKKVLQSKKPYTSDVYRPSSSQEQNGTASSEVTKSALKNGSTPSHKQEKRNVRISESGLRHEMLFERKIRVASLGKPANIRVKITQSYEPVDKEELKVRKGQYVKIIYQENDWVYAVDSFGNEGFIPLFYCSTRNVSTDSKSSTSGYEDSFEDSEDGVTERTTVVDFNEPLNGASQSSNNSMTYFPKRAYGPQLTVLYDYTAHYENDLSVCRGEFVMLLNDQDEDWFWVSTDDGEEGFVPRSFVVSHVCEACVQRLSSPNGASLNSPNLSSSDVTPLSSSSTGMKCKSWQTDVTSSTSSEKTYTLKGTRLIVLYNFEGKAFDDLTVRPGEYVYANLKDQIVPGYIWAYSPNSKKSGFIPDDHVKEPVITDI